MSEIPNQPPSSSLLHVSPMERVKRAPWVDIGLVAGAVALTIIGGLAHFGVLHHIGSLSQTAIQEAAFEGAGGLLFLEAGQRITRNYLHKRQVQPIVLESTELAEYSYEGNGYTVKGKIPKHYHEEIPEALERATKSSQERGISLKKAIEEQMDGFAFEEGSISVWAEEKKIFSGEYHGGWRLRFDEEQPPLTILGSFPDYNDGEILRKLADAEQTEKEIEKALDAYFQSYWASGKIKVNFGGQVLIREYEFGRPVKQPLPSAINFSQEFDYYIYGIDKHIYFYDLPDQIVKRSDFLIYPKDEKVSKDDVLSALDHAYLEEKLTGTITFQIEHEKRVTVTYVNGEREE